LFSIKKEKGTVIKNLFSHKIPINTKTAFLEVLEHGASLMLDIIFTKKIMESKNFNF